MGHLGTPENIAGVVSFLVSKDSAYMIGVFPLSLGRTSPHIFSQVKLYASICMCAASII